MKQWLGYNPRPPERFYSGAAREVTLFNMTAFFHHVNSVKQLREASSSRSCASRFLQKFFPTRELEDVVGKPPHWQDPARMTFPSTDFPQTECLYTSARATWNSFTPSDSEIPTVDCDQTHVVMMKRSSLHPGIKYATLHVLCCDAWSWNACRVAELTGALLMMQVNSLQSSRMLLGQHRPFVPPDFSSDD